MSTAPVAPHQSWLRAFGRKVGQIIGVIAHDLKPIEDLAVPLAESILPQYAPLIGIADGIFERIVGLAKTTEASFAAVGQASNGPAKLNAVITAIGPILDNYVTSQFPGSHAILQGGQYLASKTAVVNSVVAFLNSLDATLVPATPTAEAIAAASAAVAAIAAANPVKS